MEEAILNFNNQLGYEPEIIKSGKLGNYKHYVVCGMGGSHLATGILKMWKPGIELYVHRSYDLPPYDKKFLKESLLIASSYSGNTEEVVSFLKNGLEDGHDVAVIASGGELIKIAKEKNIPYIQIPNTHIQPRSALGFSLIAMAKLIDEPVCIDELRELKSLIDPTSFMAEGDSLAESIGGKIPVIYSSIENLPIVYNWKIKFNETGKIPAFYNLFSELNHNEMQGFGDEKFSDQFHIIILRDKRDHPKIQKRMAVTADLLESKGYSVTTLILEGESVLLKVFSSLIVADWTALRIAKKNGYSSDSVPMIEEFKRKLVGDYPDHFSDDCVWC